jgi:lysine 6-dehydrogenase
MKAHYAILGAGMQGTAAAYDLAKFADAETITLGDVSLGRAEAAAARVNALVGRDACRAAAVDALGYDSISAFLEPATTLLSCVPYWMHPKIADVAIATGTNMCDLGGNTEITLETLAKSGAAEAAGVTLVPDCGLAPGLVNSLGWFLMEQRPDVDTIRLYCGVLPQHPQPPLNYKVTFNVEGLVTEYDYNAVVLRNGEIVEVPTLDELETMEVEPLGLMEAFTTSGGTSTAPYTLQGRIKNYDYKTFRFPGHCAAMRLYRDFGLWREDEIEVRGVRVRPKDVFCHVFGEALSQYEDTDQCIIRAIGENQAGADSSPIVADIYDRQDEATGFTSMERLTGFSLSIVAQAVTAGQVAKGAVRYENAMTGTDFVTAIRARGIEVRTNTGD